MSSSSPPRSYSPIKSHPSEETIQAYPLQPLAFDHLSVEVATHDRLLQTSFDALETLCVSLAASATTAPGLREALDCVCKTLVQVAARAQDLTSATLKSLLVQVEGYVLQVYT